MLKRKSPSVAARAGKERTRATPFYPAAPAAVKPTTLVCGICHYFTDGRRKFCSFLGESVRPADACRVEPAVWEAMP